MTPDLIARLREPVDDGTPLTVCHLLDEAADALETLMEHAEALSASLAFWAAKQTCDEALQDTTPAPWRDCSPEQRLKLIAARKETHDNEVLRARQSLAAFRAAFPGEGV